MTADPDLLRWLPHRAPMLLLESVREADAQGGTALVRVDPGAGYADPSGAMPAWFGLELMAQTIAACRGRQAGPGGAVQGGYLVAVRSFASTVAAFAPGALLEVRVRLQLEDPCGLCGFLGEIVQGGQVVVTGTLRVMEHT
jgi:predicted hotdog family 3-hydroxylacyl-ACP dehydratase